MHRRLYILWACWFAGILTAVTIIYLFSRRLAITDEPLEEE